MADGGEVIFKFLGDDKGLEKTLGKVGKMATTALKGIAVGTAAAAAGFAAIVTQSVKARGEMEQLEGGVNKLFGADAQAVIDNAAKAYKEAGISASDYMNQVTNFSASLISSLKGDTRTAAEVANRAIKDMADNANTFGTSIESIQNAYQGFAKQNYTMLDNLKLGYAGTKSGMEKLIHDAASYKDIQKELNLVVKDGDLSFSNIANAISVVQSKMQIMGTTEAEAMNTLTGSIQATKAAWENFLAGTGDLGPVLDSASIALDNILRIVDEAMPQIIQQVNANMPKIIELGGKLLTALTNGIIEYLPQILDTVVIIIETISNALLEHGDQLGEIAFSLMKVFAKAIVNAIPHILLAISDLIGAAILGITSFNDKIWTTGFDLFMNFVNGVKDTISKVQSIIDKIKSIISKLLGRLGEEAKQWGIDMLVGFAKGVQERLGALKAKVEEMANAIRSKLHFSRPDEGPLRDYETWMPDMIKGMAESLNRAKPMLLNEINDLASAMSMSPTLNGGTASYNPSMNIVVNNTVEQDPLGQIVNQIKTFSNGAKNDYNYGYGG